MPPPASVFPLVPRRRLIGLSYGGMHSARRGRGTDPAGSRLYEPGDDVHAIDWASSARWASARSSDDFIVREHYADEAPRVVVLCDLRPSMAFCEPPLPWLSKPRAMRRVGELIVESTIAARGFLGYLDVAGGRPLWRPPRSQRGLSELGLERPLTAPPNALAWAVEHLKSHRRSLPPGSFVFVLSDFLEPPPEEVWLDALEYRWDLVPIVIQDPVWEQSFPDVAGVAVPLADPRDGRVRRVRLSAGEVAELREANEQRCSGILGGLRALDLEPVLVSSDDATEILAAFLEWTDWRRVLRGRPR